MEAHASAEDSAAVVAVLPSVFIGMIAHVFGDQKTSGQIRVCRWWYEAWTGDGLHSTKHEHGKPYSRLSITNLVVVEETMKNRKTITNYEWRQHAAVLKFRFWTLKAYAKTRPFVIQLSVFRIFFFFLFFLSPE